ncbi:hypothetical protein, partial [Sulfurimonas indica]|uniref:hypothetical protein n=1 Tax=Sulfurimonas indica TaxID=2508707 RepID=UPI00165F11AC
IKRVGAMGVAGEIAKGDAFQKGKYHGDLSQLKKDMTDIEKSKSDSMHGQARGVRRNYQVNPDMYDRNAAASEKAKQQSLDKSITAQGGEDKYAATQARDAALKATMQQKAQQGALKEYIQGQGYTPEAADKMAKAIMEGGK